MCGRGCITYKIADAPLSLSQVSLGSNVLFCKSMVCLSPTVSLFLCDFRESLGILDFQHGLLHRHKVLVEQVVHLAQILAGSFQCGAQERQIVRSLHSLLVEVVDFSIRLRVGLVCATQAPFLAVQDPLLSPEVLRGDVEKSASTSIQGPVFLCLLTPESWQVLVLALPVSVVVGSECFFVPAGL